MNHSILFTLMRITDMNQQKEDIREWSKKVKKGGIVSGHDYVKKNGYGVIEAVGELNEDVTIWKGDHSPSWSYVKK